jgi:multidrug efflux system membrane fusion protein
MGTRTIVLATGGGLAIAALAALLAVRLVFPASAQEHPAKPEPIPVSVGTVETRTLPVFLDGIGTVQADNTDTIRTQVDGKIVGVDFTEGQEVKAGTLLFQIDPRPYAAALAQAEAMEAKDEAQLTSAEADLARYSRLLTTGFQTRQSYDQQKALVAQVHASIAGDKAAVDTAQINLGFTQIRAPISGRLGAQLVDIGNIVRASDGTALVTLKQIKPIFVDFALPQQDLDQIRVRQAKAPLRVEALSPDNEQVLATGKLTFIDNAVQASTGTIQLKAEFTNSDERLWPGAFVNVRVLLDQRRDVPTVPATAVQQGAEGYYAYVVHPDGTVERQGVEVAAIQDGLAAITGGLSPGQKVVTDGQYRLTDGAHVTAEPAAKAAAG